MNPEDRPRRPSLEPLIAARVGLVVGAVVGALIAIIAGTAQLPIIIGGAALGGFVAWWSYRRDQ